MAAVQAEPATLSKLRDLCFQVLIEEKMAENSERLGEIFRQGIRSISSPHLSHVRGKGLMNALVLHETDTFTASALALRLKEEGLLCKPTHGNILRMTPPLCITEAQLNTCVEIVRQTLLTY